MSIRRASSVITSTSLGLIMLATGVQAQEATSTPDATATTMPDTIDTAAVATDAREGWTLVTGTAPAFALQLPPGWSEQPVAAGELAAATSETGASLALTATEPAAESDFEAYVGRVEKKLEKARKGNLPTVFRRGPAGLVARLDQAPGKRQAAAEHTALFLFPACPDGFTTLSISGMPPAPAESGAPDEWDLIAASVNPCVAEPTPQPVVGGAIAGLASTYFDLAAEANGKAGPIVTQLNRGGAVTRWTKTAGRLGAVYDTYGARFQALPWTPETSPLADEIVRAYAVAADLFGQLAKARNARGITSRFDDIDSAFLEISTAGRAIRLALGLPTAAQ